MISVPKSSEMFGYVHDLVKKSKSGESCEFDFNEIYSKFGAEMDYSMEDMSPYQSPICFHEQTFGMNEEMEMEVDSYGILFVLCRAKKNYDPKPIGCSFLANFKPIIVEPKHQIPYLLLHEKLCISIYKAHDDNDLEAAKKIEEEWGITHAQTDEGLIFYVDKHDYLSRAEQAEHLSKQQQ